MYLCHQKLDFVTMPGSLCWSIIGDTVGVMVYLDNCRCLFGFIYFIYFFSGIGAQVELYILFTARRLFRVGVNF